MKQHERGQGGCPPLEPDPPRTNTRCDIMLHNFVWRYRNPFSYSRVSLSGCDTVTFAGCDEWRRESSTFVFAVKAGRRSVAKNKIKGWFVATFMERLFVIIGYACYWSFDTF